MLLAQPRHIRRQRISLLLDSIQYSPQISVAAPELAEVARKLIEDYEAWQRDDISPHEIGDIVDEARDAYAKARGETS